MVLIETAVEHQKLGKPDRSKLKLLVPTVANFFTTLALHDAFIFQDQRRAISYRRFVPPSFNDVRLVLNTAQVMSLVRSGPIELVTFDGDVTLYDDGMNLLPDNPIIPKILHLMRRGSKIGIVTAAGYTKANPYYGRLFGLLHAIQESDLPLESKQGFIIMGGESSFCFQRIHLCLAAWLRLTWWWTCGEEMPQLGVRAVGGHVTHPQCPRRV